MTPTDSLLLEAKQAILEEQHRRFQSLQTEGKWTEAMQQFQVTLGCASDLLSHSLSILEQILQERVRHKELQPPPPPNEPGPLTTS
jgi:hypothetical protein